MKVYRLDIKELKMSPCDILPVADVSTLDGTDYSYHATELEALEKLEPMLVDRIDRIGETETKLENHLEIVRGRIIALKPATQAKKTGKPSKNEKDDGDKPGAKSK